MRCADEGAFRGSLPVIYAHRIPIMTLFRIGLLAAVISVLPALPKTGLLITLGWIAALAIMFLLTASACAWLAYRKSALFRPAIATVA